MFIGSMLPIGYAAISHPKVVFATGAIAILTWITQGLVINPNIVNEPLKRNLQPLSDGGALLGISGIFNYSIKTVIEKNSNKTWDALDDVKPIDVELMMLY